MQKKKKVYITPWKVIVTITSLWYMNTLRLTWWGHYLPKNVHKKCKSAFRWTGYTISASEGDSFFLRNPTYGYKLVCDISGLLKGNYKSSTWGRAVLPTADADTAASARSVRSCCQRLGEPWPATFLDTSLVWGPKSHIRGPAQMSSSGTSAEPSLLRGGRGRNLQDTVPILTQCLIFLIHSLPLPLLVVPRSIKPLEAFVFGGVLMITWDEPPPPTFVVVAHLILDQNILQWKENWTGRVGGFSSFHLLNVLSWRSDQELHCFQYGS